jgi:hypothetical protein
MPRVDLREAMLQSASGKKNENPPSPSIASSQSQAVEPAPIRLGRAGKSNVTGYFPPEVKKQLRLMGAEQDKTIQRLLAEALNDLFAKHGKPEIAPLGED